VEKKIKKIQRWLERCLIACRSGSWENALAEMECANAEMKTARRSLWMIVANKEKHRDTVMSSLGFGLVKASILAVVLLFMSAVPLSRINLASFRLELDDKEQRKLEFVNLEEKSLLRALRKSLSDNGFRETAFIDEESSNMISGNATSMHTDDTEGTMYRPVEKAGFPTVSMEQKEADNPRVAMLDAEKLITLVQIGERTLRESEPGIRIKIQR